MVLVYLFVCLLVFFLFCFFPNKNLEHLLHWQLFACFFILDPFNFLILPQFATTNFISWSVLCPFCIPLLFFLFTCHCSLSSPSVKNVLTLFLCPRIYLWPTIGSSHGPFTSNSSKHFFFFSFAIWVTLHQPFVRPISRLSATHFMSFRWVQSQHLSVTSVTLAMSLKHCFLEFATAISSTVPLLPWLVLLN